MRGWLYALAGTLLGWGGAIVFNQCTSLSFGLPIFILGILIFSWLGYSDLSKTIWPSRRNWTYETNNESDSGLVFQSDNKVHRLNKVRQETNIFYSLNLIKERWISGVSFWQGYSNNIPEECEISFYNKQMNYLYPNKDKNNPFIMGTDGYGVQLEVPVKAQYINGGNNEGKI